MLTSLSSSSHFPF